MARRAPPGRREVVSVMLEINAVVHRIEDLEGRVDALRGYL